jgi:hypothetical protein
VLMALLALYFLSSSGTGPIVAAIGHVKASVRADVVAPQRKAELLAIIERAEEATREDLKSLGPGMKELLRVAHLHESTAADIQPLLQKMRTDTDAYQERMVGYRFELKDKMSREEWAKVFPPDRVG